ncbi:MAG TPA: cytochrome c [Vicinamibacterales bacterium]
MGSIVLGVVLAVAAIAAQPNAAQQPTTASGQGGGRGVITSPRDAYPTRPPDDPAAIERGKALYGVNCQFCHGVDTRGGDGGPSLLRSGLVLDDRHGELIAPVVQNGRADRGMPKFSFSAEQVADIAAFIHTYRAAGYDESRNRPANIVVGDAHAGEAYFARRCASCHSATGDLRGLATRLSDPRVLQQAWLMPGSGSGRGSGSVVTIPPTRVVVTTTAGERVEGVLERIDDFVVSLTTADKTHRSFARTGDSPRVEIKDPLGRHKDLLREYKDTDIHNVTAYLVTLK